MLRNFFLAFATAAVFVAGQSAQAASLTLTPVIVGVTSQDFLTVITDFDPNAAVGPVTLQVEFLAEYTGTSPMGGVVFNVNMAGLAASTLVPDWQANNPSVDHNGALPGALVPLFTDNGDLGTPGDFVGITATIATNLLNTNQNIDPRLQIGRDTSPAAEPRTNLLGSLYLDYNGGNASLSATVLDLIISNNGLLEIDGAPSITVNSLAITAAGGGPVDPVAVGNPVSPGPISLQGAFDNGSGVLDNAIVLTNSNPTSDPALSITSLALSAIPGQESIFEPGLFGATIDGLNVDLSMDLAAAKNGPGRNVSALLTVNTNGGVLTYNLVASVPEPSTIALAGLAMVGLVGFARRSK